MTSNELRTAGLGPKTQTRLGQAGQAPVEMPTMYSSNAYPSPRPALNGQTVYRLYGSRELGRLNGIDRTVDGPVTSQLQAKVTGIENSLLQLELTPEYDILKAYDKPKPDYHRHVDSDADKRVIQPIHKYSWRNATDYGKGKLASNNFIAIVKPAPEGFSGDVYDLSQLADELQVQLQQKGESGEMAMERQRIKKAAWAVDRELIVITSPVAGDVVDPNVIDRISIGIFTSANEAQAARADWMKRVGIKQQQPAESKPEVDSAAIVGVREGPIYTIKEPSGVTKVGTGKVYTFRDSDGRTIKHMVFRDGEEITTLGTGRIRLKTGTAQLTDAQRASIQAHEAEQAANKVAIAARPRGVEKRYGKVVEGQEGESLGRVTNESLAPLVFRSETGERRKVPGLYTKVTTNDGTVYFVGEQDYGGGTYKAFRQVQVEDGKRHPLGLGRKFEFSPIEGTVTLKTRVDQDGKQYRELIYKEPDVHVNTFSTWQEAATAPRRRGSRFEQTYSNKVSGGSDITGYRVITPKK